MQVIKDDEWIEFPDPFLDLIEKKDENIHLQKPIKSDQKKQNDNEEPVPVAKPGKVKEMMMASENPVKKLIGPVENMIKPTAERLAKMVQEAIWKGLRSTPFGMFMNDLPPRKKGSQVLNANVRAYLGACQAWPQVYIDPYDSLQMPDLALNQKDTDKKIFIEKHWWDKTKWQLRLSEPFDVTKQDVGVMDALANTQEIQLNDRRTTEDMNEQMKPMFSKYLGWKNNMLKDKRLLECKRVCQCSKVIFDKNEILNLYQKASSPLVEQDDMVI